MGNIELILKAKIPEYAFDEFLTDLEKNGKVVLLWRSVLIHIEKKVSK